MAFIVGGILIGAGASIAGAAIGARGAKSAAKTAAAGSAQEVEYLRESRDIAREDQAPYREAGYTALDALMSMTGLKRPSGKSTVTTTPAAPSGGVNAADYLSGFGNAPYNYSNLPSLYGRYRSRAEGGPLYNINETGPESVYENGSYTRSSMPKTVPPSNGYVAPNIQGRQNGGSIGWRGPNRPTFNAPNQPTPAVPTVPRENPGGVEGGYSFMTDPGYGFRIGEGMRTLERGAAARGGLLSGGYGRRSTRYAQDYASNEYTNVYNRIANIAGLGQVSAQSSGNQALMAGQGMGTAAAQGAYASAYGQQAAGNAWANAANQIGQLPWGAVFNRGANKNTSKPYTGGFNI